MNQADGNCNRGSEPESPTWDKMNQKTNQKNVTQEIETKVEKSPAWDKYENIEIMRTPLWESNEIKHGQTCQAVVNCKWWKYQSSPWEDVHQQYATLEIERCKEIDRDKLIVHRKQRQSSKAFIKAAQSENKKSENKKVKNRKEGKGSSTARKYCNSCGLEDSFKSEILGKSWRKFSRNYNNQRQPKSVKAKGKQTEQAVGANITSLCKHDLWCTGFLLSASPFDASFVDFQQCAFLHPARTDRLYITSIDGRGRTEI